MTVTRADYLNGCRTPECRAANNRYEQQRRRRKAPPFVAAGRARAHVRELLAAGMTLAEIAQRAGVPRSVLHQLMGSPGYPKSRRIRPDTEEKILGVHTDVAAVKAPAHADRAQQEPWWLDRGFARLRERPDLTWRADARCTHHGVPTWIFFPGRGDLETLRAAQAICNGDPDDPDSQCPVREKCLKFALDTNAVGIWGGTTEQQRERMLGRRGG